MPAISSDYDLYFVEGEDAVLKSGSWSPDGFRAGRNGKIGCLRLWRCMGYPPGSEQPTESSQTQPATEQAPKLAVDTTPYTYLPQWDLERERREQRSRAIEHLFRRLKQFGAVSCISLFIYLATALLVLLIMTPETMQRLDALGPMSGEGTLFVITPFIVPIAYLDGLALVLFFILIVIAITVSFLYMIGESFPGIINEFLVGRPGRHSTILTIGGLFFAILTMNVLYYSTLGASGVSPTTPDFGSEPLWVSLYGFAEASVWEEVISRVLLIGVPLLWIDLLFRRGQLLQPIRYFIGGKIKFGAIECALILFSSVMFGLAHVQAWDIWKVTPTAITGLCFGYLFVRIGLYAAIIFHFSFDFLDIPTRYFGDSATVALGLLTFVWLAAGLIFLVYYAMQLGRFVSKNVKSRTNPSPGEPGT